MVVSSNISVSHLVEFLIEAFAVIDKWDDYFQEVFAIFTFPMIGFKSRFVLFWCSICLNFQWRTVCRVNLATSLFTLVTICQRHLIVYPAMILLDNTRDIMQLDVVTERKSLVLPLLRLKMLLIHEQISLIYIFFRFENSS